jgi:hypothetical protein
VTHSDRGSLRETWRENKFHWKRDQRYKPLDARGNEKQMGDREKKHQIETGERRRYAVEIMVYVQRKLLPIKKNLTHETYTVRERHLHLFPRTLYRSTGNT